MKPCLDSEKFEMLRRLETSTVSNAIDSLDVRLRNEGYANSSIRCLFRQFSSMLGYAVTLKVRSSNPPPDKHVYVDRTDWWSFILQVPAPRIVVIQDVDEEPGRGAFLGEVHCNVLMGLGCVGAVTNGSVRDTGAVERMGFQLFAAGSVASHGYCHIVEIGGAVEVAGLPIKPGDLLHGDRDGVVLVPPTIAAEIPPAAVKLAKQERELIDLCRSHTFTLEQLRAAVKK